MPFDEKAGIRVAASDGEPVFIGKKKIGYVYECEDGEWGAVSYNSEMGHEGMTKEDAIEDVKDMYRQSARYARYLKKMGVKR